MNESNKRKQNKSLENNINDDNKGDNDNDGNSINNNKNNKNNNNSTAVDKVVINEIDEKIKRLEEIEKNIKEQEMKMLEAAKIAEERAIAMEKALQQIEETQKKNEADRLARDALFQMAVGPISYRSDTNNTFSPYATRSNNNNNNIPPNSGRNSTMNSARNHNMNGPPPPISSSRRNNNNNPLSARGSSSNNGGNITSRNNNAIAPPTARSARGGEGIPHDAPHMNINGKDWYELWDPEQYSNYWYCPQTFEAQWDAPNTIYSPDGHDSTVVPYFDSNNYNINEADDDNESGYESAGAMTDYSTDYNDDRSGAHTIDSEYDSSYQSEWQEYWDEQAQAKYWYNTNTVRKEGMMIIIICIYCHRFMDE